MFIFIFCFLPQILFEIRHDGIMSKALYNFVVNEKTFTLNFLEILFKRINIYYNLLYSKFWLESWLLFLPFFTIFIYKLVLNWKEFIKNKKIQSLIIIFLSPFIGTLFFVSNLGGFYDYYFTAYYLIFILFFVVTLSYKSNNFWIYLLLIVSIFNNIPNYLKEYNINLDSGKLIAFENQIKAIDYIYKNSDNSEFNIDVYVPPVVPYAYDYLFLWQSKIKNDSRMVKDRELENLYTLYEVDIDHPERLEKWLERQEKIGKILKEVWFGGIVVQQRERYAQEF